MSRNIVLLCSAGMSTSILVNKMRAAAEKDGYACDINAYALTEASNKVPDADIVLLGPQVRFNLDSLKKKFPDKIIEIIPMQDYGMMNGEKVLTAARASLKD